MLFASLFDKYVFAFLLRASNTSCTNIFPPPPSPEAIEVHELPLPPAVLGSCTRDINPYSTGCILQTGGLVQSGSFLPDNNHVIARVNFTGASPSSDAASIYTGDQIIIIKSDNTTFSSGSPWKCITCGVPETNVVGRDATLDYPQAFRDGKRLLAGTNIIDCGQFDLASDDCTPAVVHIYTIRWSTTPDNSGAGGLMRELRLHPDNVHIGYSSFTMGDGKLGQNSYFAKLEFNPLPTQGTPLAPRYDLTNVTILSANTTQHQPILVEDSSLSINPDAITVGELRGFSGTGKEVAYIGYPGESSNIDVFAADLTTGAVRRITSHPEYCDPLDISPDDEWTVIMDTRGSNRQMFMAGMRHIPPIIDLITTTIASSTRNNGNRRFFQPYLLDKYGDRGDYFGQKINAAGDGSPGSINDPQWNGMADPRWSLDGTKIAYWQSLTIAPACGGINPLPCPNSTEPGGRTERLMVAHLTSRKPLKIEPIKVASDTVPWGTPYEPGMTMPSLSYPAAGDYTLAGAKSGLANITLFENANSTSINSIAVSYSNYSDDGLTFLRGWENVTVENPSITLNMGIWFSDLVQSGVVNATKRTSADGFRISIDAMTNIFDANGTLTTTIDGVVYEQPANGT
ncbi:hypothetical protein BDV96DRAFT_587822 [Lophiotrema nucula]|uniref:Saponin hydrolase n=1 Tax=Lophiotrema nucula TaxID=690887 RepID=A0A6A5YN50_9PLEO|nr:hypothetical protein BDV96DRAFT_587822 [Lophiotrema nucula]